MKALDILKLATKGVKPSEIKKINEKGIDTESVIALVDNGYSAADLDDLVNMIDQANNEADQTDHGTDEQTPDNTVQDKRDTETAGVNKDKETEQLKQQLAAAQNLLANKDLSGTKVESPEDKFRKALQELI